ncbi:MAG: hypothetical protein GX925_01250 [Clostridiales bacterium]|nr:hypothetical protein [Clostridiales bacterium]
MAIIDKIYLKENDVWNQKEQIDLRTCGLRKDKRGVSFISSEGNARLVDDHIKGFCHIKFRANFVIKDININNLTEGKILQMGEAVIEVTEVGKECFIDCPIIKKLGALCTVNKQIFFGEILRAGIVKEKDSVILI